MTAIFGKPYTRESWTDTVTVAVFDTVEKFLEWTKINGKRSEPGIPAYSQGNWD